MTIRLKYQSVHTQLPVEVYFGNVLCDFCQDDVVSKEQDTHIMSNINIHCICFPS